MSPWHSLAYFKVRTPICHPCDNSIAYGLNIFVELENTFYRCFHAHDDDSTPASDSRPKTSSDRVDDNDEEEEEDEPTGKKRREDQHHHPCSSTAGFQGDVKRFSPMTVAAADPSSSITALQAYYGLPPFHLQGTFIKHCIILVNRIRNSITLCITLLVCLMFNGTFSQGRFEELYLWI